MNTWKVIFATLVIFGAGLVTGALFVKNTQHHPFPGTKPPSDLAQRPDGGARGTNRPFSGPPPMFGMRKGFIEDLDRELELTVEQRERIEKILCDGQECTKQIWDKVAPEVKAEWKRVKAAIRAELTEEQRQKFEKLMKRSHNKQEERRPPRDDQPPKADLPQPVPAEAPPANP